VLGSIVIDERDRRIAGGLNARVGQVLAWRGVAIAGVGVAALQGRPPVRLTVFNMQPEWSLRRGWPRLIPGSFWARFGLVLGSHPQDGG
jgi:hypothetical protein